MDWISAQIIAPSTRTTRLEGARGEDITCGPEPENIAEKSDGIVELVPLHEIPHAFAERDAQSDRQARLACGQERAERQRHKKGLTVDIDRNFRDQLEGQQAQKEENGGDAKHFG